MTLEKLENRVAALLERIPAPMTVEEFAEKWQHMNDIDKSIYVGIAECPELFGVDLATNKPMAAICKHLEEQGLVGEKLDFQEILSELEK